MSEYEHVQRGSLKLKNVSESLSVKKKKKRKKEKELQKMMEKMERSVSRKTGSTRGPTDDEMPEDAGGEEGTSSSGGVREVHLDRRTPSEIAFEKAKMKRTIEDMMKKPIKTHKDRIMEFNQHLDNLSEHYDIPKVSWTK